MARPKKQVNALTFLTCKKCNGYLRVSEAAQPEMECTSCLLSNKGINPAPLKKPKKGAKSFLDQDELFVLERAAGLSFNGKLYGMIVYAGEGLFPEYELLNSENVIIYRTGAPDLQTEEGYNLYEHLLTTGAIPAKKE